MPYLTKYHITNQSARVLLHPIAATLGELERRTRHYVERVNLDPGDDVTLIAASEAIARARAEVERLISDSGASR
jgi:hypothetical protein